MADAVTRAALPLEKMRVASFCHYLQGPACSQYLADLGADVVKIEPPQGAFERHWSGGKSYVEGVSAFFLAGNRNKRSLAVDLKKPAGRDVVMALIERANVVVENFRPGVLDRLGLGYDAVRRRKSDIIYASGTGFGATGPLKDRPGQDMLMQAHTGLVAATGDADHPSPAGAAVIDQHGASLLAMGIIAAYVRWLTSGQGTRVESSLFNAGVDIQMEALTKYLAKSPGRRIYKRDHHVGSWYHDAPYGVYKLRDRVVALSMNDPVKLARALGSERLHAIAGIDRYAERDRYARTVAEELKDRNYADTAKAFDAEGVWYEPVLDYDDLRDDPQAVHNQVFATIPVKNTTATVINHPLRYDGEVPPIRRLPPEIGEHSREILAELGYAITDIDRLFRDAVVFGPVRA